MGCPITGSTQLVWFITGTSCVGSLSFAYFHEYSCFVAPTRSGFGHELALSALRRGDKVIATAPARSMSQLDDLRTEGAETIEFDVTAPIDTIRHVAAKAVGVYSKVDVIVNNAGTLPGMPVTH